MIFFEERQLTVELALEKSVLAELIAAGLAEPISDEERELAQGLRDFYEKEFGAGKRKRKRKR